MNWNRWIRQVYRWLSIAFTAGVVANVVELFVLNHARPSALVGRSALAPLMLLLASGLYLFVLPYAVSWRGRRAQTQEPAR